jgi:hypothetical protein
MATIPNGPIEAQADFAPSAPKGARTGSYDGMPVDRAAMAEKPAGFVHAEKEYFAQANAGGIHQGLSGDTAIGARKGNRTPQHPAPTHITTPSPFSNLRGGR